jgi:hypothetical protein
MDKKELMEEFAKGCEEVRQIDKKDTSLVGLRFDQGKLPVHLLPPELMIEVSKVLEFGAKKYAPRNWEKGMDWSRVYSSLTRHLLAWWGGEDKDPETGLSHLSHIGCNIAFLIAYNSRKVGKDDRPSKV